LTLSFEPDAVVAADDPSIQFSTGGRTVNFTVPANSSQLNLPAQLSVQTGSIAGLITLRATLGTGGSPSPAGSWSVRVTRAAPVIRSVRLVRTGSGLEVWVTGYSNTRDLGQATFEFQQGSSPLQNGQARLDYAAPARQWFQDAGSRVFGAQFTIIQPFTLNGDQTAVAGVTVTLTNSAGTSRPVAAQ
jgi:hypothetical protein